MFITDSFNILRAWLLLKCKMTSAVYQFDQKNVYKITIAEVASLLFEWFPYLNQDLCNSMSIHHCNNLLIKYQSLSWQPSHAALLMWIERGACSHKTESDFHPCLSHEITCVPFHSPSSISSKVRAVTQLPVPTLKTINHHLSCSVLLRFDMTI